MLSSGRAASWGWACSPSLPPSAAPVPKQAHTPSLELPTYSNYTPCTDPLFPHVDIPRPAPLLDLQFVERRCLGAGPPSSKFAVNPAVVREYLEALVRSGQLAQYGEPGEGPPAPGRSHRSLALLMEQCRAAAGGEAGVPEPGADAARPVHVYVQVRCGASEGGGLGGWRCGGSRGRWGLGSACMQLWGRLPCLRQHSGWAGAALALASGFGFQIHVIHLPRALSIMHSVRPSSCAKKSMISKTPLLSH